MTRPIILALCLAACSDPPPSDRLDPTGFLDVEQPLAAATWTAAERWSAATHGLVSHTPGRGWKVRVADCPNPGWAGCAVRHRREIRVPYRELARDPEVVTCILVHELGHAYGLDHVEDRASIMWPYLSTPCPIYEGDIAELYSL